MIDKDSARAVISLPDMAKFSQLRDEEKELLKQIIFKIKCDQLSALKTDLTGVIWLFLDNTPKPLSNKLFALATLQDLSYENLKEIGNLIHDSKHPEKDKQLISALTSEEQSNHLDTVYNFRHQYYLDKPSNFRNNSLAFPERTSELKLKKGHKYISMFFNGGCTSLTAEEKSLLAKAYPLDQESTKALQVMGHLRMKIFRREAHIDISLTLKEIQVLICCLIAQVLAGGDINETTKLTPLQGEAKKQFLAYTKQEGMQLIANDQVDEFKVYLETNNYSVNDKNFHTGLSFLAYAVKMQKPQVVAWLLSKGANVNSTDAEGYSCLHYAVEGSSLEIVALLLQQKPVIDVLDRGRYSALYVAAELGKTQFVSALLKAGAEPNSNRNRYGNTPLHIAIRSDQLEAVKALLADPRTNLTIKDNSGHNAHSLAAELNKADVINLLNNHSTKTPIVTQSPHPAMPVATANRVTPSPTTLVFNWANIVSLATLYANAKQNHNQLVLHSRNVTTTHFMPSGSLLEPSADNTLSQCIQAERQALIDSEKKFFEIASRLKELTTEKITFAQAYQKIYGMAQSLRVQRLSSLRFAEELVKNNLSKHLQEIEDNKTVLQVASEGEELDVIASELERNPEREYKFNYKDRQVTELEYAIFIGKAKAVAAMLSYAKLNQAVKLGIVPKDAEQQAERNYQAALRANPAYKEADDYFNIDIPQVSQVNTIRILRELKATGPKSQAAINYMFTEQEYVLLRMLLNDKKNERQENLRLKKLRVWLRRKKLGEYLERLNGKVKSETDLKAIASLNEEIASINLALEYLTNDLESGVQNRHRRLALKEDTVKISNIYRHATSYVDAIKESGKLETVQDAIDKGNVKKTSTPEGTRRNIFFSPPGSELTPLRSEAGGVIELDMAVAIDKGLLQEDEFYTTTHLPAHTIERVEPPVILLSDNPDSKTIYRIYHTHNTKIHVFDYILNDRLIGSKKLELKISEEIFMGNNIRMFALRTILLLRHIKGPLANSYADYFYQNCKDVQVVRALQAALFNVLNVEGKVTRAIDVNHEAVRIVPNDVMPSLPIDKIQALSKLISSGQVQAFKDEVTNLQFKREQLSFAITLSIITKNLELFDWLIEKGVSLSFNNNEPLREAITQLERECHNARGDDSRQQIKISLHFIQKLLYLGSCSNKDPKHVRYAVSGDNFSLPTAKWQNTVRNDFNQLVKFLFHVQSLAIQKLVIGAVNKHLHELYSFTACHGFFDLHTYIAERLAIQPLFHQEIYAYLIVAINNDDSNTLIKNLKEKTAEELDRLHFLMAYAVLAERLKAIAALYPLFKLCSSETTSSSLILAIKYKREHAAKELMRLGADPHKHNIVRQSAMRLEMEQDLCIISDYYLSNLDSFKFISKPVEFIKGAIAASIRARKLDLLDKFLANYQKVANKSLSLSELTELSRIAIDSDNIQGFIVLYEAQQLRDQTAQREIIKYSILQAAKNENLAAFKALFLYIGKDKRLVNSMFAPVEKSLDLYNQLYEISSTDILISYVTELKAIFKKRKILLETHEGEGFLHAAVHIECRELIACLQRLAPGLSYINEDFEADDFYQLLFNSSMADDPSFLQFLYENNLARPGDINEQITLLRNALLSGKTKQIKWLFQNNILQKDYRSSAGENLLQLVISSHDFSQLKPMTYEDVDSAPNNIPDELLQFLFGEGMFDYRHEDNDKKSLILYDPESKCHLARNFKEYIIEQEGSNLLQFDELGNCVLHAMMRTRYINLAIDKYMQQGGDLNAKNRQGCTILEARLCAGINAGLLLRLREKGARARPILLVPKLSLAIETITFQNNLYIGRQDNGSFFATVYPNGVYRFPVFQANGFQISISHYHMGISKRLTADNTRTWEKLTDNLDYEAPVEGPLIKALTRYLKPINQQLQRLKSDAVREHQIAAHESEQLAAASVPLSEAYHGAYQAMLNRTELTAKQYEIIRSIRDGFINAQFLILKDNALRYESADTLAEVALVLKNYTLLKQMLNSHCLKLALALVFAHRDEMGFQTIIDYQNFSAIDLALYYMDEHILKIASVDVYKFWITKVAEARGYNQRIKDILIARVGARKFHTDDKADLISMINSPQRKRHQKLGIHDDAKSKQPKSYAQQSITAHIDSSDDEILTSSTANGASTNASSESGLAKRKKSHDGNDSSSEKERTTKSVRIIMTRNANGFLHCKKAPLDHEADAKNKPGPG